METRVGRFTKLYPWYYGFGADLLFYITIDTLFLTLVKNFSAAEIVSITSISQLVCIGLQFPLLFVIKKIGNTASIRTGAFCLLLSAVLTTFGSSYYAVLIGRVFHDSAVIFRNASVVALENNLELVGRRGDFVRVRTSANTVYSVITMLISFVASYMFNLHHYFPMICCIVTCATAFAISLLMKDCSAYNRIPHHKKEKGDKVKIQYGKVIVLVILVYSLFYPILNHGQNEGKLFIQQNLLLDYSVESTALILGAVICASRVIRVLSNIVFARLYGRYQDKMGFVLPTMLSLSIGIILFASFIPVAVVKILVMAAAYTIILFVRDPFNLYIQDTVFASTEKEQHQTLLAILAFGSKVGSAGIGLAFSAILLRWPMVIMLTILFVISLVEIILSIILYRAVIIGKRRKEIKEHS